MTKITANITSIRSSKGSLINSYFNIFQEIQGQPQPPRWILFSVNATIRKGFMENGI